MQFNRPLLKLGIRFCADALASEVRALPPHAWQPHPQRFKGNEYVPLVTPAGEITNEFAGPMEATPFLLQSSYMREAMAEIGAVWGRGRLMGLGIGAMVPPHIDANYYWRTHIRVHIPIITNPGVEFTCGEETVHMAAGECWVFDTFQQHRVLNKGGSRRIHLVLDTVGGERLWDLIDAAQRDEMPDGGPVLIEPGKGLGEALKFEKSNFPRVMSPWEIRAHLDELLDLAVDNPQLEAVRLRIDRFVAGWSAAWARFEDSDAGLPAYRGLLAAVKADLIGLGSEKILLQNNRPLSLVIDLFVFDNAVMSPRTEESMASAAAFRQRQRA